MIGKNGYPWLNFHTTIPSMPPHNKPHSSLIMVNIPELEKIPNKKFEMNLP